MAERFTVLANGNVGIGTSAPGTILDIQGSTSGTSRINVLRTGGSGVGAQLLSTGSVGGVAATNGGGFSIFTSDADRVRVDESGRVGVRSEEHTSELQSLMRTSYAVFCLKTKTQRA